MRFAKKWCNLISIPLFQYSKHVLERYSSCKSFPVYVIQKRVFASSFFYYFNIKITSAQNHRILVEVYGEHALAQFKSGDFGLKVEKRSG